jgi:hypothetical protein
MLVIMMAVKNLAILLFLIFCFAADAQEIQSSTPFDWTTKTIENSVKAIDSDTTLVPVVMSDSVTKQLKNSSRSRHRDAFTVAEDTLPTAFVKGDIIMKIKYLGITYHFKHEVLIRKHTPCLQQASRSDCNGFVSAEYYNYYMERPNYSYKSIKVLNNPSWGECDCEINVQPTDLLVGELIVEFRKLIYN